MLQPVVSELFTPHMDAADDAVTDSDVLCFVQSQSVVNSSVNAEKWEKYKYKINKARNKKYKTTHHLRSEIVTNLTLVCHNLL